ncbi:MAG TPA: polymer-forming cytoskeletal protein, partial [Anaerolineae bacterium]
MRISQALKRGLGAIGMAGALILIVMALQEPALAVAPPPGTQAAPVTPAPLATPTLENDQRIFLGDKVVSGGEYTLHSNEVLRGDLTSFGGHVVLEENSRVEGNVTLFGGDTELFGTVTGDLTTLGGTTHLRASAHIEGSQTGLGGSVTRDPGA